jgi:hypothetical protein
VLLTPLPHAFDEHPETGAVLQMDPEDRLLGTNVNVEGLQQSAGEMHARLQSEVLVPLEQWLTEYRNAKVCHCLYCVWVCVRARGGGPWGSQLA